MYKYKNRVSYSQADQKGTIGVSQIVDVMQDACMFHCSEVGRSCLDLKKEHRAWLVSSWHIQIHHLPEIGEEYFVSTWPYKAKGVFSFRNVVLESMKGDVYACGDSVWFFYDQENNKPVRIPEEEKAYYQHNPPFDMDYASRKVSCPKNLELTQTVSVCRNYLDTNDHMNNGQYVRLAVNVLPDDFEVGELRAEFRNAARLQDVLYIYTGEGEDAFYTVFKDKDGQPYFLAEWKRK